MSNGDRRDYLGAGDGVGAGNRWLGDAGGDLPLGTDRPEERAARRIAMDPNLTAPYTINRIPGLNGFMSGDGGGNVLEIKDTNPKDIQGSARIDYTQISAIAMAEEALAMEEGVTKYGAYNYRIAGVRARVYIGAALRHLEKYLNGEDYDPKTGVHHLGSVRACCGIILDAKALGKLTDDRPPSNLEASAYIDSMEARVKRVREVFKDYHPRHYTIEDTQNGAGKQINSPREREAGEGSVLREDAQPVSRWDAGHVVLGDAVGPVGGVQVAETAQEKGPGTGSKFSPAGLA